MRRGAFRTIAAIAIVLLVASAPAMAGQAGKRLIVTLEGHAFAEPRLVPDIDGDGADDDAACFDVNLVDVAKDKIIGVASECLSAVEPGPNGGFRAIATTYFHFPQGTLVQRGYITIQPVNWSTADGVPVENIGVVTGSFPQIGTNNLLSQFGTGKFAGVQGRSRLSGAATDDPDGRGSTLNCIFVIDLY